MIKVAFVAAFLALAASQPVVQQSLVNQYINTPNNWNQQPVVQQVISQGPVNVHYGNILEENQVISLVNGQNQPIGYVYHAGLGPIQQYVSSLVPVTDIYGNLVGYYSWNHYTQGQTINNVPLTQQVIAELQQLGLTYVHPNQGTVGVIVVTNPNVFNYHHNGVLSPYQVPSNIINQVYNWGQQYSHLYQGPYNTQVQGLIQSSGLNGHQYQGLIQSLVHNSNQYQGPYNTQVQGLIQSLVHNGNQYQGPYNTQIQGLIQSLVHNSNQYQGPYSTQVQGLIQSLVHNGNQYQGPYNTQIQGLIESLGLNNNQGVYSSQVQGLLYYLGYNNQYQTPYTGQYQGQYIYQNQGLYGNQYVSPAWTQIPHNYVSVYA